MSTPGPPRLVIAVDVGGTAIKAARCSVTAADVQVLAEHSLATPVGSGVPAVLAAITETIGSLREGPVGGVGVIMPGAVDAENGIARYSANLGWRNLPIRAQLAQRAGLPVAIDHDVRAAARAELALGAARGHSHALFVSIGTGIAAASIIEGTVTVGARQLAGELGHVPVFPDGARCACGQRGCTETYASAAAIARRYAHASGRPATAQDVLARAAAGEPAAHEVFQQAVTALARSLVFATLLTDPGLIVLGGGLSLAGAALLDPVRQQLTDALAWRPPPELTSARFGAKAGQVGAALLGARAAGLASQA
ncbi:MAG TPA: ROK family protein [Jatrophihabitans sp.]|nr:ROK family protein [Jatrophihabitans sp.]